MSPETFADAPTVRSTMALESAIARCADVVLADQASDGHWRYPFEADATIPAEYVLMMHFLDEIEVELQNKIGVYLRRLQAEHGGWPLYYGGDLDISATVKAYWALKLIGDDIDAPHMVRARAALHERGGAAKANVFTRFTMAMFGQAPWRAVPYLPAEIVLLPRKFPFHLSRVSYWSRTVMVPLSILTSLRAQAKNPTGIDIQELFIRPPEEERDYFPARSKLNKAFLHLENVVRKLEPVTAKLLRRTALKSAQSWVVERLNGEDGLGGIFPAMANAHMALACLGHDADHPLRVQTGKALRNLLVVDDNEAWCQPCLSPVWDTGLAALALAECRSTIPSERLERALLMAGDWLRDQQQLDGPGDWLDARPKLEPGGWPFQYSNDHYPDLDDTAAVLWALQTIDPQRYTYSHQRGVNWTLGMQSKNGGFGAFDVDNTASYLQEIPFADHGALLDPPTADVTARCVTILASQGREDCRLVMESAIEFLLGDQEDDGSWFGRWGTNYIYGTWCVLAAFEVVDDPRCKEAAQRGVAWLKSKQRDDGSWGETNDSYHDKSLAGGHQEGTSFQTAWALLGLLAGGEHDTPEVKRGVQYLLDTQNDDGIWEDPWYTAPGFPRVFYLRYHGYSSYFPLWALARYRRHLG